MKYGLPIFLVFAFLAGSQALPQSTKAAPKSAQAAKKTASSKKGRSAKKSNVAAVTGRSHQTEPTPDRYKEIQQALVDKGYLKSEPNGVWDAQSSDALLRFQTDNKLSPTGKLSAASLIALGLGPKTSADTQVQPVAPIDAPPAVVPATPPAEPPPTPPATQPEN